MTELLPTSPAFPLIRADRVAPVLQLPPDPDRPVQDLDAALGDDES